ncbi:type II toxin-antitoxin system Phd/YefM family antitoxin [Jiella sp. M17.18]|uniref:type II toxin-antitoxin system Phd/YefM family antitoxin n=1 Tax=Jiella sp. M17.18 TaxID=3234247 RepID=UPI0034DF3EAA
MKVSVTEAKGQLTDLVRRAEAGEEVVLTRHNRPAVQLVRAKQILSAEERGALLDRIAVSAAAKGAGKNQDDPARSQDFLYDEDGLPG